MYLFLPLSSFSFEHEKGRRRRRKTEANHILRRTLHWQGSKVQPYFGPFLSSDRSAKAPLLAALTDLLLAATAARCLQRGQVGLEGNGGGLPSRGDGCRHGTCTTGRQLLTGRREAGRRRRGRSARSAPAVVVLRQRTSLDSPLIPSIHGFSTASISFHKWSVHL